MNSSNMPPTGKLYPGDELTVLAWRGRDRGWTRVRCTVTKVGRVWVDMQEKERADPGWPRTYRLRMDTQNAFKSNPPFRCDRFRTDAQLAWQEELDAADAILKRNGIRLDMDSPWHPPVSRIKLAQMLTDQ